MENDDFMLPWTKPFSFYEENPRYKCTLLIKVCLDIFFGEFYFHSSFIFYGKWKLKLSFSMVFSFYYFAAKKKKISEIECVSDSWVRQ